MAIDQEITPVTPLPGVTSEDRPEAVDQLVEVELPRLSEELEVMIGQTNETQVEINSKSANVDAKNANVNTKAQVSENAAANAEASAERAENAVPIGDSYNQTTIDAKNATQNKSIYTAYGFTSPVKKEDLFEETATANSIVIKASPPIRGFKGIIERNSDETITLPFSPFDILSNDEVLDDKINGLVCQQTHNKEDIVVTGNELQDNDFSIDTSSFVAVKSTISVDSDRLKITLADVDGGAYRDIPTTIGKTYIITFSGEIGTNLNYALYTYDGASFSIPNANTPNYSTTQEDIVLSFTANNSITRVYALIRNNVGQVGYFPQISVRLEEDIYQAIVDVPSNDLTTSDWQILDEVSRQDLVYWAEDKTTGARQWKSAKGLKHYLDKDILNHDLTASDKGWTKVSNNLWEDSEDYITCLSIIPRLNTGAFDFDTNSLGDKEYSDGAYKDSAFKNTTTYSAFTNKGSVLGRPDPKDSTKIYLDGESGLIYKSSSAKEIHENNLVQEWQRDCVSDLDGINSQNANSYFTTQGTALVVEDLTDTAKILWDLSSKAIEVKQVLYTTDSGVTWNTETFTLNSINNQITLGNARAEIKVSYVAQNQTLQEQNPIEILAVGNQAIASNSHSVYKGAMLGNSATSKVQVGNGNNGLGSRNIEDIIMSNGQYDDTYDFVNCVQDRTTVYVSGNNPDGVRRHTYRYIALDASKQLSTTSYLNTSNWEDLGADWNEIITTPSHNEFNLDGLGSAFKGIPFVGLASNNELVIGMFTEEGKYNASGYGWNTGVGLIFQQLANGLVDGVYENDLKTTILYKRTGRFKND